MNAGGSITWETDREVTNGECNTADAHNAVSGEAESESGQVPGDDPETTNTNPSCTRGPCSPILVDLDRRGFRLTGLEDTVRFDIDADGYAEEISWTAEGSGDAFLVLDRNGNGVVDDGAELFGTATSQPSSDDPNGYRALAVFDMALAGGNVDGRITADDAVYANLLLWIDRDHDGQSDPTELTGLALAGVESLDLEYVISNRRDRHGNLIRWKSRAVTLSGATLQTADVIFLHQ